jgi:hypothetical protein
MADHRALGRAGGAGGVDQDREIGRLAARKLTLPEIRVLLFEFPAELDQFFEADHHRVREVGQPFLVDHDDLFQARATVAHLKDLVEMFLVLRDEDDGVGIADDILHLLRGIGRIDAVGDAADCLRAEIGIEPFRHTLGHDGDDVATFHAERRKTEPGVLHVLAVLGPGLRAPDAEMLVAHGDLAAALQHLFPVEAGQRFTLDHLQDRGIDFDAGDRVAGQCHVHAMSPCSFNATSCASSSGACRARLPASCRDRIP